MLGRRDLQLRRGAVPPAALRRDPGRSARHDRLRPRRAARIDARVARHGHRRQAAAGRGRRRLPRQPAREAAGAGAVQAVEPGPRRRHLDEHAAAGVERREQRAGRRRRLGGHPVLPAALPGLPGRPARRAAPARRRCRSRPRWPPGSTASHASWRANAACWPRRARSPRDRRRAARRAWAAPSPTTARPSTRGGFSRPTDGRRRRPSPRSCRTALRLAWTTASPPTGATTASTTPTTCWSSPPTAPAHDRPPAGDARGPGRRRSARACSTRPRAWRSSSSSSRSDLYRPDQRSFLLYPARELPGLPGAQRRARRAARRRFPCCATCWPPATARCSRATPTASCVSTATCARRADLAAVLDDARPARRAGRTPWRGTARAVLALFEDGLRATGPTPAARASCTATRGSAASTGTWSPSCCWRRRRIVLRAEREGVPPPVHARPRARCTSGSAPGSATRRRVAEYGAFPTDPYSHTPRRRRREAARHDRAGEGGDPHPLRRTRRPRRGRHACASRPSLLRADEFLDAAGGLRATSTSTGRARTLPLPAGSLAFTLCQVPVVYRRTDGAARHRGRPRRRLRRSSMAGRHARRRRSSADLLARSGRSRLEVGVPEHTC